MVRRFRLCVAAVGVLALTAPVYASAAPELTINGAKAVEGTFVTATSKNHVRKTSIGNFTCATAVHHLEVVVSTGSTIEFKNAGPGTTSTCFFKGTTPITIDDFTLLRMHIGESGKGTANVTHIATLPKGLTCHYHGTNLAATYAPTGAVVHIAGPITAMPEACGTASTEGDFTLTSGAGAVVLH